jgi:hypothetical protein
VDNIVLGAHNKGKNEPSKSLHIPTKTFEVFVKFPMNGNQFFDRARATVFQFPINKDLATSGHKLQGMTKEYLIVSELNYSAENWNYAVLNLMASK